MPNTYAEAQLIKKQDGEEVQVWVVPKHVK